MSPPATGANECERCVRLAGGRRGRVVGGASDSRACRFLRFRWRIWRGFPFWAPADYWWRSVADGLAGSLFLAIALVVLLLFLGLLPVLDWRLNRRRFLTGALSQLARVTYALPGVVLAQGAFVLAALLGMSMTVGRCFFPAESGLCCWPVRHGFILSPPVRSARRSRR